MKKYEVFNDWREGKPSVICNIYSYRLYTNITFIYELLKQIDGKIEMDSNCLLMTWPIRYEWQIKPLKINPKYEFARFKYHFLIRSNIAETLRIFDKAGKHEAWLWIPNPQPVLFSEMAQWIKTYWDKEQKYIETGPQFNDILESEIQYNFAIALHLDDGIQVLSKENIDWEIPLKNIAQLCDNYTNKKLIKGKT